MSQVIPRGQVEAKLLTEEGEMEEEKARERMTSGKPREESFKKQGGLSWVGGHRSFPGLAPGASPLEEQKSSPKLEGDWNQEVEPTCEVNPFEKA